MALAVPHRVIDAMSKAVDSKQAILDKSGDLSTIEVLGNMVLLGVYIRPERTAGGIIRPDMNKEEDLWQGKVGLVLKVGPWAFVDDDNYKFFGSKFDIGDWGVFKIGDAWPVSINGYPCKLVRDSDLKLKVSDPNSIF